MPLLTGTAWHKAHPPSVRSGGRPKGALGDKALAVQAFCRSVCEDPEYRERILQRAIAGTLGPMEPVLWAYAYGKPKEYVQISVTQEADELAALPLEEQRARVLEILQRLEELTANEKALEAALVDVEEPGATGNSGG